MFIEVLYADLTRERRLIEFAHLLPKAGVLAIILSAEDEVNPRIFIDGVGYRRVSQVSGKDHYYLIYRRKDGKHFYGLDGRDEGDFVNLYARNNPWNNHVTHREYPRFQDFVMSFEGQQISDEEWDAAMILFNEEIH